ncbi:hypothetical protein [Thalassobius sp. Cn5-15]|uniref:hypothetical protein n=1 Tax=Thalassobius sp. Cn5-15 TaxID=2917763 RepID=UPI001EF19891|nr:hypothetical protein [Thalassobius sp. Cn5-15]MCG7494102.1 hypothetical protein [Thalassobius sp. Cn5-15]
MRILNNDICRTHPNTNVRFDAYLGANAEGNEREFKITAKGATRTYRVTFLPNNNYSFAALMPPRPANSSRPQGNFGFGDLFGFAAGMFMDGMAGISGTTREEMLSSMGDLDSRCFQISGNDDAVNACLNEPYLVKNKNAQNILLGFCHQLDDWAEGNGLDYVCDRGGKDSCHQVPDSDHSYSCYSCNGTRRWAAIYATGTVLTCFQ